MSSRIVSISLSCALRAAAQVGFTGSVPVEYILYDLWESMRAHDKYLANEVLEPVFTFMRAQTDKARLEIHELGQYLEYREKDVGKA